MRQSTSREPSKPLPLLELPSSRSSLCDLGSDFPGDARGRLVVVQACAEDSGRDGKHVATILRSWPCDGCCPHAEPAMRLPPMRHSSSGPGSYRRVKVAPISMNGCGPRTSLVCEMSGMPCHSMSLPSKRLTSRWSGQQLAEAFVRARQVETRRTVHVASDSPYRRSIPPSPTPERTLSVKTDVDHPQAVAEVVVRFSLSTWVLHRLSSRASPWACWRASTCTIGDAGGHLRRLAADDGAAVHRRLADRQSGSAHHVDVPADWPARPRVCWPCCGCWWRWSS